VPPRVTTEQTTDANRPGSKGHTSRSAGEAADSSVNRAIGTEIRRVRDHRRLTRGDVVARMTSDISVQTLANYEYGIRPCTIHRLVEICQALEVATDTLVALALQRSDVEPVHLNVDLRALIKDNIKKYEPLRQWANNRLKNDDETGIARIGRDVLKEMAALHNVSWSDFLEYLGRFMPDHAPRRTFG
jgi:transcriptional regulator with XRE-family HTH domain